MEYLGDYCEEILKSCSKENFIAKVKSIPLHVNLNGHNVSIIGCSSILVLDNSVTRNIIKDGIEQWAASSGTILLRTSEKLKKLYALIGITNEKVEAIDIYTNHLLPKFRFLPRDYHLKHLAYVQKEMLAKSLDFNEKQNDLICVLKNVCFVPDYQQNLYQASHFKNPFNSLMKAMCRKDEFPGEPFQEECWRYLLETAGIESEVTSDLIVHFAQHVEGLGRTKVTDEVVKKSEMLIRHIFNRPELEKQDVLGRICGIKFIVPYMVEKWKTDVFNQPNAILICYKNSIPHEYSDICWTTCSVLPHAAHPQQLTWKSTKIRNKMIEQLQICKEPSLDSVIKHTQNICDSLKLMADDSQIHDKNVIKIKFVMVKIYACLLKYKDSNLMKYKKTLFYTPIIFHPKLKILVTCNRVVKSLQTDGIKPYLMEVPEEYGEYFKLFEVLGMNTRENICNFIRVLQHLKKDVGNKELLVTEMQTVQKALQGICNHFIKIDEQLTTDLVEMDALYLPSRNSVLANARSIVYSDNIDFEEKIGSDIGMPYMMQFEKLEVSTLGNIVSDFKKLPLQLQPNILSDLISKELNEESLEAKFNEKGRLFRDFVVSPQFLEAAVRITVHCLKKTHLGFADTNIDVNKIIAGIEKLRIRQVHDIRLSLVFHGKIVGKCKETCYYHTKDNEIDGIEHILLCSFEDREMSDWLVFNCRTICQTLQNCTNNEFIDTQGLLLIVLHHIRNPDDISRALDRIGISQFSVMRGCSTSIFPPAGTVVHPDWHCYLDNSFSDFDIGEYVALLLNEETKDKNVFIPALYQYAIIVQKCEAASTSNLLDSILCRYEVNVGERTEIKMAYDLYKFNRKKQESSKELSPFLDIADGPKDDRNLDDIFKEVKDIVKAAWSLPEDERRKVIKRLYKKWHPDKNHGNEDLAKTVFQFLQQIVLKMESGQDIDSDSSSTFKPPSSSYFYSYFRTWDEDARHDSSRNQRRGKRGGRSGHTKRQPQEPVPSHHESRQWIKQAKVHLTGAVEFLPHAEKGPNFNIICMICYQSVEMALKAMFYQKDANSIPDTKNILELAVKLDRGLDTLVQKLVLMPYKSPVPYWSLYQTEFELKTGQ
ncbi:SACS [Mytilus edulis]|uniref:SACS n=1 Tax=Mytilus edulis TaxID=6550 RepID=A0A8S3VDW8_MYTED|nr:SACS [Mytilus edulis]